MLRKTFRSVIGVILWLQSTGIVHSTNSHNLYDTSNTDPLNILETELGILNFLDESTNYQEDQISDMTPHNAAVYDFIIVGAGTAGATLAARLSDVPHDQILLIEAGPKETLYMDIPLIAEVLQLSNRINWMYETKPSNKYCLGMRNKRCAWPRGKVMGGTSILNYMIATRGSAEDYDRWAEMGNDGWAYQDVLKYFKKLESMDIPELQSDTEYHGTQGPVHITRPTYHTESAKAFLQAGQELGYPLVVDYNGKEMIGFSYVQATIYNGTRMSSNRAYLTPIRDRKNLHVTHESMVRKVLIDRPKKKAIGVEFTKNNKTIRVFARKEVILCAGSIGSPQLLMLSGIGPAQHLSKLGINVIKDALVGENLMDHVAYGGLTFMVNDSVTLKSMDIFNPARPYLGEFLLRHTGPFAIPGGCEAIGFINTKYPEKRSGTPDIEFLFSGGYKGDLFLPIVSNFNEQLHQIWDKYLGSSGWTIFPMLLKPKSRGRIRLLANDVNVKPEIIPNYFDDPEDVKTMTAGIRASISVSRTMAMQEFGSQLDNDTLPGCEYYEYDSDDYWECAMRTVSSTIYHFSGTCKMGPRTDPTAVVDPRLKVIGIQGLRVADASIMPEIISAHTNIPVYMIAEKAADMIKEDWGYLMNKN